MKIKVPGKVMLAGEYAVLFGGDALAFTVDRFLTLDALYSSDGQFHIASDMWVEKLVLARQDLNSEHTKQPLVRALFDAQTFFKNPALNVSVTSDLDATGGLGSSSAIILAACLASYLAKEGNSQAPQRSFFEPGQLAYRIQKSLQGSASGYDVLTQLVGGLVLMSPALSWPGQWSQKENVDGVFTDWIHLYVGGKGAPTTPVMNATLTWLQVGDRRHELLRRSAQLTEVLLKFFLKANAEAFAKVIAANREHRAFLAQSPHFPLCGHRLAQTTGCDQTWTFKTTGAGGEDALLIFGPKNAFEEADGYLRGRGWYPLEGSFLSQGVVLA